MRKIAPIICLIVIVVLTSCDGRSKASRSAQDDLIEKKALDSFSEIIEYYPESYVEVVTDTTLNSGFQIKISTATDMNDNILNEIVRDSVKYKQFYRNYVGEVNIAFDQEVIFKKIIDKTIFKSLSTDFPWDKAIMGQITLDQENTSSEAVFLDVFYCVIESQNCIDYKMIIDRSGNLRIEDLNDDQIE